jgi:hypothetical protein
MEVRQSAGSHIATAKSAPLGAVIVESKFKYVVIRDDVWSAAVPLHCVAAASSYKLHLQRRFQVFCAAVT